MTYEQVLANVYNQYEIQCYTGSIRGGRVMFGQWMRLMPTQRCGEFR